MKEFIFGVYILIGVITLFSYFYNQITRRQNLKKLEKADLSNDYLKNQYKEIKVILDSGDFCQFLPTVIFLSFVPIVDLFVFFTFIMMVKLQNLISRKISLIFFC